MNFDELKVQFETITGTTEPENADVAIWFNECLMDLAPTLGSVAKHNFSASDLTEKGYLLPSDFLRVFSCGSVYSVQDGRYISFVGAVPTDFYYRQIPKLFTGTSGQEECSVHPYLHHLLPYFAASRYWDLESEGDTEESNHATKWMNYYLQNKMTAQRYLQLAGSGSGDRWQVGE